MKSFLYRVAIVATFFLAAIGFSACGVGPDKSREDAHDATSVDKTPPEVVTFNNHFANVETKCDGHGHRIFQTSDEKGSALRIYPDPTCPGFIAQGQPTIVIGG